MNKMRIISFIVSFVIGLIILFTLIPLQQPKEEIQPLMYGDMSMKNKITYEIAVELLSNPKLDNQERLNMIYNWVCSGRMDSETFSRVVSYGWEVMG